MPELWYDNSPEWFNGLKTDIKADFRDFLYFFFFISHLVFPRSINDNYLSNKREKKNVTALQPFVFLSWFRNSLSVILLQLYCLSQTWAFRKEKTMWPAGFIAQYPSTLLGYCMTGKSQIILWIGKTSLMNKLAHASTQGGKWTRTQPKPTEVFTHLEASKDSPHPVELEADGSFDRWYWWPQESRAGPLHCACFPECFPVQSWHRAGMSGSAAVGLASQPPLETPRPGVRHSAHIPSAFRGAGAARSRALALFPSPRPDSWHMSQRNRQKVSEEGKEIREQHRMLM